MKGTWNHWLKLILDTLINTELECCPFGYTYRQYCNELDADHSDKYVLIDNIVKNWMLFVALQHPRHKTGHN